jgi:hypothetical protein
LDADPPESVHNEPLNDPLGLFDDSATNLAASKNSTVNGAGMNIVSANTNINKLSTDSLGGVESQSMNLINFDQVCFVIIFQIVNHMIQKFDFRFICCFCLNKSKIKIILKF